MTTKEVVVVDEEVPKKSESSEKMPKKQCAMLVFSADGSHRKTAMINAVGAGGALLLLFVSPWAAAVALLALAGYDAYIYKSLEAKIKYLREKYGLG